MALRIRRSLLDIQADHDAGNATELDNLMRAWHGIKQLPPMDPNSFFMIGGYHGEPFRGAGWGSASYWGGYCNHGNVLFPTWHRAYLLRIEDALRSIEGCADVTLPFWDETSPDSLEKGIPWALTRKDYALDGVIIPNPLRSFMFMGYLRSAYGLGDHCAQRRRSHRAFRRGQHLHVVEATVPSKMDKRCCGIAGRKWDGPLA